VADNLSRLTALDSCHQMRLRDAIVNVIAAWPEGHPLERPLATRYLPEMAQRVKAVGKALNEADVPHLMVTWNAISFSEVYARALLVAARNAVRRDTEGDAAFVCIQGWLHDANRIGRLHNVLLAIVKFAADILKLDGLRPTGFLNNQHPDGPEPPNRLWWKNHHFELSPQHWSIVNVMWGKSSVERDVFVEAVWATDSEAVAEPTVRSTLCKLNKKLSDEVGIPWSISLKRSHVVRS
jgi:hypothetical protein